PGTHYPPILLLVVTLGAAILLRRLSIGRHIYVTGSSDETSRLSGVRVNQTKLWAYAVSGAVAGRAGNVLMSGLVSAQPG
ncbi:ABC transporter permease subunit, partial [Tritonibacter sp. SIMBA_163]|uniref:ABC transporter permease subunit n=1 Tax=Tritonibacter sp. SIMBA_163 TaxID=3080868 RepID=UPI003980A6AF